MRSKRTKRRLLARSARNVGIGIVCLSVITGCSILDALNSEEQVEVPVLKTVKVETVTKQRIEEPIAIAGDVLSFLRMDVVAKTGGKVEQVWKRLGDTVRQGEPLARLSSEEAMTAREQAAAALERAKEAVEAGKQELANRRKELSVGIKKMELEHEDLVRKLNKLKNDFDAGLATQTQLSEAEIRLEAHRIDLELAKQQLRSTNATDVMSALEAEVKDAELALQRSEEALLNLEVASPIDGTITSQSLIAGAAVESGDVVAAVDQIDPLRIVVRLSEEAADLVRGKTELLYAVPNAEQPSRATINYLTGVMEPETKTYEMSLEAPRADSGLKPGMKVSVQLTEDADQIAVGIPQYSVLEDGSGKYVFVLEGDIAKRRSVQLGRASSTHYEVLSGVREGEKLVVMGQSDLKDQEQVLFAENVTAAASQQEAANP